MEKMVREGQGLPTKRPGMMSPGAMLVNIFSGGPTPHIHMPHPQPSTGRNVPVENSLADYAAKDEELDQEYVKEHRKKERDMISRINEDLRKSGKRSDAEREVDPRRRFRPGHPRDQDISVQGTEQVSKPESIKDYYSRIDFDNRRRDCTAIAITACRDRILSAVNTHQVTIIEGFTGCGKTTQVPQFVLEDAASKHVYCNIAVTQPRRIAAISNAVRVSWERKWNEGGVVGYQVGMKRNVSDESRIVYMTTGVLLQKLIQRKDLGEYTHIIIDEVHERDLETDLLMLVVKRIMMERVDVRTRIILMSATINVDAFMEYFPKWRVPDLSVGAVVVQVPQVSPHTITEHYLDNEHGLAITQRGTEQYDGDSPNQPKITEQVYEMAAAIIVNFDTLEKQEKRFKPEKTWDGNDDSDERGAVLVFLPGLLEIDAMLSVLHAQERRQVNGLKDAVDKLKWTIYPLHSTCTQEEQQRVFKRVPKGRRKIILATNIAESSITVADIKYVIDFCLTKSLCTDPCTNYTSLRLEWASKNQCIQRRGRCGRVAPGRVYRMVPKAFYDGLVQEAPSGMVRSSLENVVLQVKKLDLDSPKALLALAMEPPKLSGIRRAVANLKEVGALTVDMQKRNRKVVDEFDGDLTYLGDVIAKLPIDVRLGRMIMLGHVFGLLEETIIIAAGMTTKSPFSNPYHRRVNAYMSKLFWAEGAFSDSFALINVYRTWETKFKSRDFRKNDEEQGWAKQYLVQSNILREIFIAKEEITERLKHMSIQADTQASPEINEQKGLLLKLVIAGAFYPNYFVRPEPRDLHDYYRGINSTLAGRNPATTVVFQNFPTAHPAETYAGFIVSPFLDGSNPLDEGTIPTLEADGEKLLLCFDIRGHKVGSLSHGVYRAVKMRLNREKFSIPKIRKDDAEQRLDNAMKKLTLGKERLKAPPQVDLPAYYEKNCNVYVSHVVSPTEFYVVRSVDTDKRNSVEKTLESCKRFFRPIRRNELLGGEGNLVIVERDGGYHRARVESISTRSKGDVHKVAVFQIDVGGIFFVTCQQLHAVDPAIAEDLYSIPGLAIQCRISELKCLSVHDGKWSAGCLEEILKTMYKLYEFKIFSVIDGVMAGDLITPETGTSLRDKLIREGFAEAGGETQVSMGDHTWRIQQDGIGEALGFDKSGKDKKGPSPFPDVGLAGRDDVDMVVLRGPASPLELTFYGVCKNTNRGKVLIEGVNSVALDQDYLNPSSRLVVAGSVSVSDKSSNLIARDTTLLPPIPGLPSLLTLVFGPQVELRVSKTGERYTGVLAGLGYDSIRREAIYGDHDVEMTFDVDITRRDIEDINVIRVGMNYILRPDSLNNMSNFRETVVNTLLTVLNRQRSLVAAEETFERPYEWKAYGPELQVLIPGKDSVVNHNDVFQLHSAFQLQHDKIIPKIESRSLGWN